MKNSLQLLAEWAEKSFNLQPFVKALDEFKKQKADHLVVGQEDALLFQSNFSKELKRVTTFYSSKESEYKKIWHCKIRGQVRALQSGHEVDGTKLMDALWKFHKELEQCKQYVQVNTSLIQSLVQEFDWVTGKRLEVKSQRQLAAFNNAELLSSLMSQVEELLKDVMLKLAVENEKSVLEILSIQFQQALNLIFPGVEGLWAVPSHHRCKKGSETDSSDEYEMEDIKHKRGFSSHIYMLLLLIIVAVVLEIIGSAFIGEFEPEPISLLDDINFGSCKWNGYIEHLFV